MKISKSLFFKFSLIAGLLFIGQLSFADETPILLPPDGTTPQPRHPNIITIYNSCASATFSDTELATYIDWSVSDATITVYDADDYVVYQETLDTDKLAEVDIPFNFLFSGNYVISVTYNSILQKGNISLE